jgi:hypothetical protein
MNMGVTFDPLLPPQLSLINPPGEYSAAVIVDLSLPHYIAQWLRDDSRAMSQKWVLFGMAGESQKRRFWGLKKTSGF